MKRIQSFMVGKQNKRGLDDRAGPTVTTVRKKRKINLSVQDTFSFLDSLGSLRMIDEFT